MIFTTALRWFASNTAHSCVRLYKICDEVSASAHHFGEEQSLLNG